MAEPPGRAGDGLLARFLPHLLHEMANVRTLAATNLDLEIEDGNASPFVAKARESLHRGARLEDALRMLVKPLSAGEEWDLGEATGAVLDLLRCACHGGGFEIASDPYPALLPREGDRSAYCAALLAMGLEAAEEASAEGVESSPRRLRVAIRGLGGAAAEVRLEGLRAAEEAIEAGRSALLRAYGSIRREPGAIVLRLER